MQFCFISSLVFDTVIHIEVIFAIVSFILDRLSLVKTHVWRRLKTIYMSGQNAKEQPQLLKTFAMHQECFFIPSTYSIVICLPEKLSSRLERRKNESQSLQRRNQMMIHPLDILLKMSIL